jgi:predicted dehydrogenase
MIRKGEIGDIRFIMGEYPQEWLATYVEKTDSRQAKWRTDPKIAGKSNCVGDIGSHIENTISYMTGLRIKSICARLDKTLAGRTLDDNASIMLNYENGARGMYWSSQIAVGYDNGLWVRIFGAKGTIEWDQEVPNYFDLYKINEPCQRFSRGRDNFYPHAQSYSRVPAGHPEGYFEALGNIYKTYIGALNKLKIGVTPNEADMDFPSAEMGVDGVKFITKCVESSDKGAVWVNF